MFLVNMSIKLLKILLIIPQVEFNKKMFTAFSYSRMMLSGSTSHTNEEYAETNAENQSEDETYGFVGPLMRSGKTVDLPNDKVLHLYYPGTAPTYPTIKFTIQPIINERTHYINSPANDFEANNDNEHYDTLFIESDKIQKFCYTLPGAWNGYNQAIKIFKSYSNISNVDLLNNLDISSIF